VFDGDKKVTHNVDDLFHKHNRAELGMVVYAGSMTPPHHTMYTHSHPSRAAPPRSLGISCPWCGCWSRRDYIDQGGPATIRRSHSCSPSEAHGLQSVIGLDAVSPPQLRDRWATLTTSSHQTSLRSSISSSERPNNAPSRCSPSFEDQRRRIDQQHEDLAHLHPAQL
jgi:hypothetical protein